MPISKEAAHARAVKAAATRARNKANGVAPAFPQSYHATPTRHVTRDLRMKQTVKQPKQTRIALRDIRKADTQALRGAYNQMNAGGWKWGRGDDTRYYAIKEELRARASGNNALMYQRIGVRDIGGKKLKKRQVKRVTGTRKRSGGTGAARRKRQSGFFGYTDDSISSTRKA